MKNTNQTALATFVKTPELSPVKTRLAADIGVARASAVYEQCLKEIAATMRAAQAQDPGIVAHWAVAEKSAVTCPRWRQFPCLWTGAGGLGARLHTIYSALRRRYSRVILIGSDCPQLPASAIVTAAQARDRVVIGPSQDGGFYLFAAGVDIPADIWRSAPYSRSDTLSALLSRLTQIPNFPAVMTLYPLTDIDDQPSLEKAMTEFSGSDQSAWRLKAT